MFIWHGGREGRAARDWGSDLRRSFKKGRVEGDLRAVSDTPRSTRLFSVAPWLRGSVVNSYATSGGVDLWVARGRRR